MVSSWPFAVLGGLLSYAVVVALLVWIGYLVIRAAVRSAMDDHFRKVKWYEETGLWYGGRPPKGIPGAEELSRKDSRKLPKNERPQS